MNSQCLIARQPGGTEAQVSRGAGPCRGRSGVAEEGATGGRQARWGTLGQETRTPWLFYARPVLYSGDTVSESSKALPSFYLGAEGKADNRGIDQRYNNVKNVIPKKEINKEAPCRGTGAEGLGGGPIRCLGWTDLDRSPSQADSGVAAGPLGEGCRAQQSPSLSDGALQSWRGRCSWKQNLQADRSGCSACSHAVCGLPRRNLLYHVPALPFAFRRKIPGTQTSRGARRQ